MHSAKFEAKLAFEGGACEKHSDGLPGRFNVHVGQI
jgi:hypothetical protein